MLRHTVRIGRIVGGVVCLVAGVLMLVLPGPGIVALLIGLGLLSHEFEWARRLRTWAHREFDRLTGRDHAG
jgi:uncharacterized protein (TIGR02611 family)